MDGECGAVTYVTHALHEVVQLAQTLLLLKRGIVVGSGPLGELFSQLNLRHVMPESQIGAILDTQVADHDKEYSLTTLQFSGGRLSVPQQDRSIGEFFRV